MAQEEAWYSAKASIPSPGRTSGSLPALGAGGLRRRSLAGTARRCFRKGPSYVLVPVSKSPSHPLRLLSPSRSPPSSHLPVQLPPPAPLRPRYSSSSASCSRLLSSAAPLMFLNCTATSRAHIPCISAQEGKEAGIFLRMFKSTFPERHWLELLSCSGRDGGLAASSSLNYRLLQTPELRGHFSVLIAFLRKCQFTQEPLKGN